MYREKNESGKDKCYCKDQGGFNLLPASLVFLPRTPTTQTRLAGRMNGML